MTTDATAPEPKWWANSLTIWGAIISSAATVLPALGPLVGLDITADLVQTAGSQSATLAQAAVALAGTVMTIFGRLRATQPLEQRTLTLKI